MASVSHRQSVLFALSILFTLFVVAFPHAASAQVCAGGCLQGYSCVLDKGTGKAVCLQNCSDGSKPAADGSCLVDEIVVTAASKGPTFADFVNNTVVYFVDTYIIPLLYALAFLFFIFGMFQYFFTGGEENRQKGKAFALWGIIGMVAIFSVWGVVNVLVAALPH